MEGFQLWARIRWAVEARRAGSICSVTMWRMLCPQSSLSLYGLFWWGALQSKAIIIDRNGIHEVALNYCGCEGAKSAEIQLLRSSLYPVTSMNPKSAATFRVMKFFHLLSFESKCSGYEFYNTLSRYTNNVDVNSSWVSTQVLRRNLLLTSVRIATMSSCESSTNGETWSSWNEVVAGMKPAASQEQKQGSLLCSVQRVRMQESTYR